MIKKKRTSQSQKSPQGRSADIVRLNYSSGVPIAKQIVDQIKFMIEAGALDDGDRLPSSRMLASNLGINRNTVAHAYSRLAADGYLKSQRRAGMLVKDADEFRRRAQTRDGAVQILRAGIEECLALGFSAEEIASLTYHAALHSERLEVKIGFVECNQERADYFAKEISARLNARVSALVLHEFDPSIALRADLLLTTFFHLSEVRRLAHGHVTEVVAIVVAPHVRTLVRLAQIPANHRIGILYSTPEQAELIRDSLIQTGLRNIDVLSQDQFADSRKYDVVIVPSEKPELGERLGDLVEVIEFGNVLDEASLRMVEQVVGEIRDRKASEGPRRQAETFDLVGAQPSPRSRGRRVAR